MAQKFLYILDYFVPQWQSEYGGLLNVIAEDNDECFDVVVKWTMKAGLNIIANFVRM